MHTGKSSKASSAHAVAASMMDRLEESLLLKRWAAADSVRAMDDVECDESLDQYDMTSVASHSRSSFDS